MVEHKLDAPRPDPKTTESQGHRAGNTTKVEAKEDHFQAIRTHIAELTKTGDQTLKNALGKIIVRLDRIEGKTA